MKAIVFDHFGPPEVMKLREMDKPSPQDNEVLVKVHASSINAIDIIFRSGALKILGLVRPMMTGVRGPRVNIVGFDVSGIVEAVGENIKKLKKGDEVYGSTVGENGGHAEYTCISEDTVTIKPTNMSHAEAAAAPIAAMTALYSLRAGNIQNGQRVLINGASGGIGTFAVQLAKALGTEVTAVCSTRNTHMAESLGADNVIDYQKEDFSHHNQTYEFIFDAAGKSSFSLCRNLLTPDGIYVTTDFMSPIYTPLQILWTAIRGGKKVKSVLAKINSKDIDYLRELVEAGKVKSVIDRCYPLAETVEAHRFYEAGHSKGKVVVIVRE